MHCLECEEFVEAIGESPCPLIFLDTCAILDIPRVVCRENTQVDLVRSAAELRSLAMATPRRVWLAATEGVVREFEANRSAVGEEIAAYVATLRKSIRRVSLSVEAAFPEHAAGDLHWPSSTEISDRFLSVADQLLESVTVFQGSRECRDKASRRVWEKLPPVEYKDCQIFEEFLELATMVRDAGFAHPALFVTSNTRDYGKPPTGKEQIVADLAPVSAQYAGNISWAMAEALKPAA